MLRFSPFIIALCLTSFIQVALGNAMAQAADSSSQGVALPVKYWVAANKSGIGEHYQAAPVSGQEHFYFEINYTCIIDGVEYDFHGYCGGDIYDLNDYQPYTREFTIYHYSTMIPATDALGNQVKGVMLTAVGIPIVDFEIFGHNLVGGIVLPGEDLRVNELPAFGYWMHIWDFSGGFNWYSGIYGKSD